MTNRICKQCLVKLIKRYSEGKSDFEKRRFCSRKCRGYYLRGKEIVNTPTSERNKEILRLYKTMTCAEIGKIYGITPQAVNSITRRAERRGKADFSKYVYKKKVLSLFEAEKKNKRSGKYRKHLFETFDLKGAIKVRFQ